MEVPEDGERSGGISTRGCIVSARDNESFKADGHTAPWLYGQPLNQTLTRLK